MSNPHIKNMMIWSMICNEVAELSDCEDRIRITELVSHMIEKTKMPWRDIQHSYNYVDLESQRRWN